MLHKAIALEREQGTKSRVAAEQFSFSCKLRIPKESKDISLLFSSCLLFLGDDVGLFSWLLKDSCFQLYTIFSVI